MDALRAKWWLEHVFFWRGCANGDQWCGLGIFSQFIQIPSLMPFSWHKFNSWHYFIYLSIAGNQSFEDTCHVFFSKNMDSPPWNLLDSNFPSQAESDVVPFLAAFEHPYTSGLSERDLGGAKCWDRWKRGWTLRTPCLKAWNRLKPTMCSWCNMTGSFPRASPWHGAKFLAFSNDSSHEAWLV